MSLTLGPVLSKFSILAFTGVSNISPETSITGDVGTVSGGYSGLISTQIEGTFHPVNDSQTQTAHSELVSAYTFGSSLPLTVAGAWTSGSGPYSGTGGYDITNIPLGTSITTLGPGVYNASGILNFPSGTLVFDAFGNPNANFIIKTDDLNVGSGASIVLTGGANSCNIYFLVNQDADIGSGSDFVGNILSVSNITLDGNNIDIGRLLSINGGVSLTGGPTLITNVCICYAKGTNILTPHGYIPIENIKPGDEIFTFGDIPNNYVSTKKTPPKLQKVTWIGYFTANNLNSKSHPVCIKQNAIGPNSPRKDLYVSPNHGIYTNNKFISARYLMNNKTIYQDTSRQSIEYYHIETERHSIILAEGVYAESFLDSNQYIHKTNFSSIPKLAKISPVTA